MEFLDLAKSRCTTRGFNDTPISEEDLQKVLSASRVAPSACNRQPQRIIVVREPENLLERIQNLWIALCPNRLQGQAK